MTDADRRAFADRAAEREIYKANALTLGFVWIVKFKRGEFLREPIYPGQIIATELQEDCVYRPPSTMELLGRKIGDQVFGDARS